VKETPAAGVRRRRDGRRGRPRIPENSNPEDIDMTAQPTEAPARSGAARMGIMLYSLLCYVLFLIAFLYAIGFLFRLLVPKHINSGEPGPWQTALLINTGLLALFVVQHTVMARPAFKRWWTRIIPPAMERSTFVLAASLILLLLFWQWRPLPQAVWDVSGPAAWGLHALAAFGWAMVLLSSFVISHFDLFGLRQGWLYFLGKVYRPVGFQLRGPYRMVRHPLMLGFLIAFWATPHMTAGHLFFAVMTTVYIFMGTWFEERDLVAEHGEAYLDYRRRVPSILPIKGIQPATSATAH
jgi:protein-S-isoprenylcysteine O-methyltransferase Ste14